VTVVYRTADVRRRPRRPGGVDERDLSPEARAAMNASFDKAGAGFSRWLDLLLSENPPMGTPAPATTGTPTMTDEQRREELRRQLKVPTAILAPPPAP